MNLGAALFNDYLLLEARLANMRQRQLITCCPNCMKDENPASPCPVCRPRSNFPSAFSSQAEWDTEEQESPIDIPLLATKISLPSTKRASLRW